MMYFGALGNDGNPNANSFMSNTYGVYGISNIATSNDLSSTSNSGVHTDFTCPGRDIWSTHRGNQ